MALFIFHNFTTLIDVLLVLKVLALTLDRLFAFFQTWIAIFKTNTTDIFSFQWTLWNKTKLTNKLSYMYVYYFFQIKHFYTMMSKYGEACRDIVPGKVQHVFQGDILKLLPNRDQHGRRILVLDAGSKYNKLFLFVIYV